MTHLPTRSALLVAFCFGLLGCDSTPKAGGGIGGSGSQEVDADADGDGVADDLGVGIDADGDGELDEYETGVAIDTDGDGEPDAAGLDTDGDGIIDALDTDFDGEPDEYSKTASTDSDGEEGDGGGLAPVAGMGGQTSTSDETEVCDGIDNDGNGIIDDVDAGGDGICDCLNIGTIGSIGPWSDGGNIFEDWLDERSPLPATDIGHQTFTKADLDKLDVIVVLRVDTSELEGDPAHHEFTQDEIDAMDSWVRAGGGVMTTIGYTGDEAAEIVNVNNLLDPLGSAYTDDLSLDGFITDWNEHPVSDGVSNIFTENGVTADASTGTVVARDGGDRPALVVRQIDDGRVLVWGDEWITYDSEWVDTENQQVERLWLNMIKWLSPPEECQVAIPDRIK